MNREIMRKAGFEDEVELVKNEICPLCCSPVDITSFRDELSLKEFRISGLCQKCQDGVFGK